MYYAWYKTNDGSLLTIQGSSPDWIEAEVNRQGGTLASSVETSLPPDPSDTGDTGDDSGSSSSSSGTTPTGSYPYPISDYKRVIADVFDIDESEVSMDMVDAMGTADIVRGDIERMKGGLDEIYQNNFDREPTLDEYKHHLTTAGHRLQGGDFQNWKQEVQDWAQEKGTTEEETGGSGTEENLNNVYLGGGTDPEGNPIGYQVIPGSTQAEVNANASKAYINPANLQPLEGNTWEEIKSERTERLNSALDIINDAVARGVITDEMGDFYKKVVKEYEGEDVKVEEIMKTYEKIKNETIDPFYEELADISTEELQRNVEQLKSARGRELELQDTREEQDIRQSRANLEQSGLLNTGESIKQLGQISPYQTAMEGLIPQQHRIISSSSQDQYHGRLESLARSSEKYFGSVPTGTFQGTGWNYDPMGVDRTAELPYAKEQALGGALGSLIGTSTQKEAGLGNLNFNFSQYNQ